MGTNFIRLSDDCVINADRFISADQCNPDLKVHLWSTDWDGNTVHVSTTLTMNEVAQRLSSNLPLVDLRNVKG